MSTIHASRQALDLRATVAGNVQLARHLADVSQAELARRTGIDEKEISRYEHGRRRPGDERLIRIAGALEVPVSWFFDEHDAGVLLTGPHQLRESWPPNPRTFRAGPKSPYL